MKRRMCKEASQGAHALGEQVRAGVCPPACTRIRRAGVCPPACACTRRAGESCECPQGFKY